MPIGGGAGQCHAKKQKKKKIPGTRGGGGQLPDPAKLSNEMWGGQGGKGKGLGPKRCLGGGVRHYKHQGGEG